MLCEGVLREPPLYFFIFFKLWVWYKDFWENFIYPHIAILLKFR